MLNPILHNHLGGRLTGYKITTTSSPSISVNVGDDDLVSSTRNSAGKSTLVQKTPYARDPIIIGAVGADIALGGFPTYDTTATESTSVIELLGAAGSGDDGTGYALSFGWDYVQDEHLGKGNMSEIVNTNGYEPVVLALRINADATVALGTKLISVSKASSVYTITFRHGFARSVLAFPSVISATAGAVKVNSTSTTQIVIATSDTSGTPGDLAFQVLVLGWLHKDALWGRRSIVQTPKRKPSIIPFAIDGTGTASMVIGADDITLTDNGTGDYTIAWKTPSKFTTAPIVIPTGKVTRTQLSAAASATSANILSFNAAGAATDDDIYGIALGFDVADEYAIFG